MSHWDGRERRKYPRSAVTKEQLDQIIDYVEKRVLENFYREVGKVTIRSCVYVAGAACVSALAWLGIAGKLK